MKSLLLLGRQPALGLAELESLYGPAVIHPLGDQAVLVDIDPCLLAFDRLGGSVKFCKVLSVQPTTRWQDIEDYLVETAPPHVADMPAGKMLLGLSAYGIPISIQRIEATGLTLKKAIRKSGRSVRLVPNKTLQLNSAQVLHNHLTGPRGWELVFVADTQGNIIIAQTVKEQDIVGYTKRDQMRPKRDAKIGMLPPKLAQIIINLAAGVLDNSEIPSVCNPEDSPSTPPLALQKTVLDPFCGSGVILQESVLMGYRANGSDIDARMVAYAQENLEWLEQQYDTQYTVQCDVADATMHQWPTPIDFIASESYLGRPFTSRPTPEVLTSTISDCNLILKKFLRNWQRQSARGTRLCVAVPAWQIAPHKFRHLPLVDQLKEVGYNAISFEHTGVDQLIYYRPDQFVARQLLVLVRT